MSVSRYFGLAARFVSADVAAHPRGPVSLDRRLRTAMADRAAPTLAPGEGREARRLLALVPWERVPCAHWCGMLRALERAAWWHEDVGRVDGEIAELAVADRLARLGIATERKRRAA